MTGYGAAREQVDRLTIAVEVRTVNNRHLKLITKISEPYSALEPDVERLVRDSVHRGTVQLSLRVERPRRPDDYKINVVALQSYRDQILTHLGGSGPFNLAALLALPGVVETTWADRDDPHADWESLACVVREALRRLHDSRADDGRAMAAALGNFADEIGRLIGQIADRAPLVVTNYNERLRDRVQALVRDHGITVAASDLLREVALFADRGDIAEELLRLRAHVDHFRDALRENDAVGRKLEFVLQEMQRETNTIGSKANDVEISRAVVDVKGHLERIRELIQNIE